MFAAWQKSPSHNENLLRDDVTDFGLALVYDPDSAYQTYWAMLVASPLDAETVEYLRRQNEIAPLAATESFSEPPVNCIASQSAISAGFSCPSMSTVTS